MTILEQFWQRSQTKELFLWAHLSLLAFLPLALVLTMAGLAVGEPLFPGWIEMPVLAIPIIAYVGWQQANRPIYPFTLGFVHRSVSHLSVLQRQILTIVKRPATGWIAIVTAVFLYVLFRQVYQTAPLAENIAPFPDSLRFLGIVWALVFFLVANVITQVGIVALRVLVLPATELNQPYDPEQIKQDFIVLGSSSPSLWQFDRVEETPDEQPKEVSSAESPTAKTEEQPQETPKDEVSAGVSPTAKAEEQPNNIDRTIPQAAPEVSPAEPPTAKTEEQAENIPPNDEVSSEEEVALPDIPDLVFTTEQQTEVKE